MNEDQKEHIIEGRKTFFVVPDATLLPETFLEDFMARGYETYIIGDDRYCPLKAKVEVIIETFTDSILFFYIDMQIKGVKWEKYIKELQEKYMGRILIGVIASFQFGQSPTYKCHAYKDADAN